jgi:hypothetical protein
VLPRCTSDAMTHAYAEIMRAVAPELTRDAPGSRRLAHLEQAEGCQPHPHVLCDKPLSINPIENIWQL